MQEVRGTFTRVILQFLSLRVHLSNLRIDSIDFVEQEWKEGLVKSPLLFHHTLSTYFVTFSCKKLQVVKWCQKIEYHFPLIQTTNYYGVMIVLAVFGYSYGRNNFFSSPTVT